MKYVTSTYEPVNPWSDAGSGRHHVTFASRPYPRFFPRLRKKLGGKAWVRGYSYPPIKCFRGPCQPCVSLSTSLKQCGVSSLRTYIIMLQILDEWPYIVLAVLA